MQSQKQQIKQQTSTKDIEIQSTLNFANQMMRFFTQMRDECHDFLSAIKNNRDYFEKPVLIQQTQNIKDFKKQEDTDSERCEKQEQPKRAKVPKKREKKLKKSLKDSKAKSKLPSPISETLTKTKDTEKEHKEISKEFKEDKVQKEQITQNKIKKPPTAFMMYYSENYNHFAQKYPGNKLNDMIQLATQDWKTLSKEEREPWEQKYDESRENYLKELTRLGLNKIHPPKMTEMKISQVLQEKKISKKSKITEKKNKDQNEDLKSLSSFSSDDSKNN